MQKIVYFSFLLIFCCLTIFAQSYEIDYIHADTLKVRYLVWDSHTSSKNVSLTQTDGYVIKFHAQVELVSRNLNNEDEDILFLDDKKNIEKGFVLKYILRK